MSSIEKDLEQAGLIVSQRHNMDTFTDDNYGHIYYSSNEDLNRLFREFDFRGKKVLSVLASSDQVFHFYNRGASEVDTFDINKLTIHYYYLRKWGIQYNDKFYLENMDNDSLCDLLLKVRPSNESEKLSFEFWKEYIKRFNKNDTEKLFMKCTLPFRNNISDLSTLKGILDKTELNFYNMDIFLDCCLDEEYDIIYKSNISDYISDFEVARVYRDNLYKLLKKGGYIISSNLLTNCALCWERIIFDELFDYYELPQYIHNEEFKSPGYVLRKK